MRAARVGRRALASASWRARIPLAPRSAPPRFIQSPVIWTMQEPRYFSSSYNSIEKQDLPLPPRVQAWLDRKHASTVQLSMDGDAKDSLLTSKELVFKEFLAQDPQWIDGVVKEVLEEIPVGSMTEPVFNLCHSVMRVLRNRGNAGRPVQALLMRLIEEEDLGNHRWVSAVLYSIAMDAWAKQPDVKEAPQYTENLLQLMQDRFGESTTFRPRPQPRASHVSQVLAAWSNSSLPEAPARAEQLLHWMQDQDNNFPPSVYAYTSVIHAYAKQGKAQEAERLLYEMETSLKENPNNAVRFNVRTFTAVMNAWANANQGRRAALRAERVLRRMKKWQLELNDDDLKPNVRCLTTLMNVWAKAESADAGKQAERLFRKVIQLRASLSPEERKEEHNLLTSHAYNAVIEAWSKAGHPEISERILNDMLENTSGESVAPTNESWSIVAQGWARLGNVKRTEDLLKRMDALYRAGHTAAKPNVFIYNSILLAWSKREEPKKAQHLLDWMEEQRVDYMQPNSISYSIVMSAWNNTAKGDECAKRALPLFERVEKLPKDKEDDDDNAFGANFEMALSMLAKGDEDDTHLQVLKLFEHIEALHEEGTFGPILSRRCFITAITSCAWAPTRGTEEICEDILKRMEAMYDPPDKLCYEAACVAWARSFREDAPIRAKAVFDRMMEARYPGVMSTRRSFSKMFQYILASCWATNTPESSAVAKEVLLKMKEAHGEGVGSMLPSPVIMRHLASGRERHSLFADPLEDMISEMEQFSYAQSEADADFKFALYSYALSVWGFSVDLEAAARAEALWERMRGCIDISPDLNCFNSVLRAYSNQDEEKSAARAEKLLLTMEKECARDGLDWKPDSSSYDYVIETWAKSKQSDAPERAFRLLKHMDFSYKKNETHVKPSARTYDCVLLACALTPPPDKASKLHRFNIAVRGFNHLRESEYCEPDPALYNRLLMCAIYLAPDYKTRVKMAEHVFRLCCRDGCVDKKILKHFWEVLPKERRLQLLGREDDDVRLSDVPEEWHMFKRKQLNQ